jgi:hypothetical protein
VPEWSPPFLPTSTTVGGCREHPLEDSSERIDESQ